MGSCIICREITADFSDEHVIPDALGGYYHIYSVCRRCNSTLGTAVDAKLVNHRFAEFQRYLLGLRGKSKKLPNPFAGTHHLEGDESKRVQLRLDDSNRPTPYMITDVTYHPSVEIGGATKVDICVDASDEKKLDGIIQKIARKFRVPIENLEGLDKSVRTAERPHIKCSLSIDLAEFKIGLLKIAYEFAVDSVAEYFGDPSAIEVSQILKQGDSLSAEKFVIAGSGFDHELFNAMSSYLDLDSKKHYLILLGSQEDGLLCFIRLYGMFSIGFKLSMAAYPEDLMIIGVNDIENKSFRKVAAEELLEELYSSPELRFQYYFPSEDSLREFITLQQDEEFGFYRTDSALPVFDRDGMQLDSDLYDKMKASEHLVTSEALEGGGMAHTFPLQEELFIKVTPSGKLVQIVAVREELRQIGKL